MDAEQIWVLAYVTVLGIRLHPKNDADTGPDIRAACLTARNAAKNATQDWDDTWQYGQQE